MNVSCSPYRFTLAWLLGILSAALFCASLMAPCFSMHPSFGGEVRDKVISYFTDELSPRSYSIPGSIQHLYSQGDVFTASLILICSILVPVAKLIVLIWSAMSGMAKHYSPFALNALKTLGKWGMLDVMIVAVVVVAYRSFPGGTKVHMEWGMYAFAMSVLLSMIGGALLPDSSFNPQK